MGSFKKYNKVTKYLQCIEQFRKWKKLRGPTCKIPKMPRQPCRQQRGHNIFTIV